MTYPVRKKKNSAGDYIQMLNPLGYLNNREITNLPGQYLVKGSQNVLIVNGEKVVPAPGYTRLGAAKTVNTGTHSSFDWNNISSGDHRSTRVNNVSWQVLYKSLWRPLKTMPSSAHMEFTTWWNRTELIDVQLGVNGTGKVYEWSGAIATVASVTSNTITKQGWISDTTISFQNNGTGISGTIIKTNGGLYNAGFATGDTIIVTGTTNNNQTCIVLSVTDTTLVIRPEYTITTEAPLSAVTIQWPNGTWAGSRFFTANAGDGTDRKILIANQEYLYTGGEGTGTLTGVSPDPTTNVTVGSSVTLDSYSETNKNAAPNMPNFGGIQYTDIGQTFTSSRTGTLTSCKFYLTKNGTPTGTNNVTAKLYFLNASGVPTGSALAISDALTANNFDTAPTFGLQTFNFSTPYVISAGQSYAIIVEYTTGGAATNNIAVGVDTSAPTHDGTSVYSIDSGATWLTNTYDVCFYIYVTTPTVANIGVGTIGMQAVRTYTIATASGQQPPAGYSIDLIAMQNNLVFYGSTKSRVVYQSKATDFTSMTWTDPLRLAGEGMTIYLDASPTAFIGGQQDVAMYIAAGTDDLYKVEYKQQTVASNISELVTTRKINIATGTAARSQASVVFIKNAAVMLTFEPTIDSLAHIANVVTATQQAKPISDPIKNDIESYNLVGAHGIYYRRNLYYTLPAEGKMIMFDMLSDNHYWQPPRICGFSRLAIITINGVDQLCAHSSTSDETYVLNSGKNDNGSKFSCVAAFGYENFGDRFGSKVFDEVATELYISQSTVVKTQILYDYKGGTDSRTFDIKGSDTDILSGPPVQDASEGSVPEGTDPEGSAADVFDSLQKARIIHQTSALDFIERQRIFTCDSIDADFAILAYGENVSISENENNMLKK